MEIHLQTYPQLTGAVRSKIIGRGGREYVSTLGTDDHLTGQYGHEAGNSTQTTFHQRVVTVVQTL